MKVVEHRRIQVNRLTGEDQGCKTQRLIALCALIFRVTYFNIIPCLSHMEKAAAWDHATHNKHHAPSFLL